MQVPRRGENLSCSCGYCGIRSSRVCDLHHSSQQRGILKGARDRTLILLATSGVRYHSATAGTPTQLFSQSLHQPVFSDPPMLPPKVLVCRIPPRLHRFPRWIGHTKFHPPSLQRLCRQPHALVLRGHLRHSHLGFPFSALCLGSQLSFKSLLAGGPEPRLSFSLSPPPTSVTLLPRNLLRLLVWVIPMALNIVSPLQIDLSS